jgi:hypothetical protein
VPVGSRGGLGLLVPAPLSSPFISLLILPVAVLCLRGAVLEGCSVVWLREVGRREGPGEIKQLDVARGGRKGEEGKEKGREGS